MDSRAANSITTTCQKISTPSHARARAPWRSRAAQRQRDRLARHGALLALLALLGCGEVQPVTGDAGVDARPSIDAAPDNAELIDLIVSAPAPLAPGFSPEITAYTLSASLLTQEVTITAVPANAQATISINGMDVLPGQPSPAIALSLDKTEVLVRVTSPAQTSQEYTIAIDRSAGIAQYAYAKATNPGVEDHIGFSLAIWEDTLVVGAIEEDSAERGPHEATGGNQGDNSAQDSGAVYVFRRKGNVWVQEAYLKASNTGANDNFGESVAIWGDILAVGADSEDSSERGVHPADGGDQADNSAGGSGAVYIFRREGSTWVQEAYIKASNADAGDDFGTSIALWNDLLAVGAPSEASSETGAHPGDGGNQQDDSVPGSGAVYVFRRTAQGWVQDGYIKASNTDADDGFGQHLTLWGNTLAVGVPDEDSSERGAFPADEGNQGDNTALESGAVYVYARTDQGWSQEAYLKSSNSDPDDNFGSTLRLWADTLIVGADHEDSSETGIHPGDGGAQDDNSALESGAVYVFRRVGGLWSQEAYLKASNTDNGDNFGESVAIFGDLLAVGSDGEDSGASGVYQGTTEGQRNENVSNSGAAYLLRRTADGWIQEAYIKALNPGEDDEFSNAMVLWKDTLTMVAPFDDSGATGVHDLQNGSQAGMPTGSPYDDIVTGSGSVHVFH